VIKKMEEITLTLKESETDPGTLADTRIQFTDRRGIAIPHGTLVVGRVVHISKTTYKTNPNIKNILIKTDIGLDIEFILNRPDK